MHTGNPRKLGGDYLGIDVNIAARVAQKAAAGEILASQSTVALLDPQSVSMRRKRTFALLRVKGVPDELEVFAVSPKSKRRVVPGYAVRGELHHLLERGAVLPVGVRLADDARAAGRRCRRTRGIVSLEFPVDARSATSAESAVQLATLAVPLIRFSVR